MHVLTDLTAHGITVAGRVPVVIFGETVTDRHGRERIFAGCTSDGAPYLISPSNEHRLDIVSERLHATRGHWDSGESRPTLPRWEEPAALRRFAVFGGRDYPHRERVWAALNTLNAKHPGFTLVHGGCLSGADWWAETWWDYQMDGGGSWPIERYPADFENLGRKAGPIRNRDMARSGLAGAIQFPGGRGTASMRRECDAAGVPVWERS